MTRRHESFERDTLNVYPDVGLRDAVIAALWSLTERALGQAGYQGIGEISFGTGAARVDEEHPELWRPAVSVLIEPCESVVVVSLQAAQCPSETAACDIAGSIVDELIAAVAAYEPGEGS